MRVKGPSRRVVIGFVLSLITLCYFASQAGATSLTGVVGALDAEVELVRANLENAQEHLIEGIKFTSGEFRGQKVVVSATGVGKVNAAMTTALLISHFKPSEVISTGVAGAINSELSPGDIVIAKKTAQYDLGTLNETGLTNRRVTNAVTGDKNPMFFPANLRLLHLAETSTTHFCRQFFKTPQDIERCYCIGGFVCLLVRKENPVA